MRSVISCVYSVDQSVQLHMPQGRGLANQVHNELINHATVAWPDSMVPSTHLEALALHLLQLHLLRGQRPGLGLALAELEGFGRARRQLRA